MKNPGFFSGSKPSSFCPKVNPRGKEAVLTNFAFGLKLKVSKFKRLWLSLSKDDRKRSPAFDGEMPEGGRRLRRMGVVGVVAIGRRSPFGFGGRSDGEACLNQTPAPQKSAC